MQKQTGSYMIDTYNTQLIAISSTKDRAFKCIYIARIIYREIYLN